MNKWIKDSLWKCHIRDPESDGWQTGESKDVIDVYAVLKCLESIEKKHGDVRNLKIRWETVPEEGTGLDRNSAYHKYWLEFDRLETDREVATRERWEERQEKQKLKEKDEKAAEEKKLLKQLLSKYGNEK
jgi:hypothetical protein